IMDSPPDSAIGGTYIGNPVAQAAALAVLDIMAEDDLPDRANAIGDAIRSRMESWRDRFEEAGDVRGLGAMLAIELVRDRQGKQAAPEPGGQVGAEACQHGRRLATTVVAAIGA